MKSISQVVAMGMRGATLLMRFVLVFYLARNLSVIVVGLFGLYWAAIQLASALIPLDVYSHTGRRVLLKTVDISVEVSRHLGFLLCACAFFVPIGTVLFYVGGSAVGLFLAALFFVHLPFEIIAADVGRLLVPLSRPFAANCILFFRSAIWVLPLIVFAELGLIRLRLEAVILWWISGSVIAAVLALLFLRKAAGGFVLPRVDSAWLKDSLRRSGIFLLATILFRVILGMDRFIVERFLGGEVLGVYTVFASISLGVLGLLESGISAWRYPPLVAAIQSGEVKSIRNSLSIFLLQNSVGTGLMICAVAIGFPLLSSYLLGVGYNRDLDAFFVILAGVFLYGLSMPYHYIIYGFRRDAALIYIYGAAALASLAWAFGAMSAHGVLGAGLMIAIALSAIAVGRFSYATFLLRRTQLPQPI